MFNQQLELSLLLIFLSENPQCDFKFDYFESDF